MSNTHTRHPDVDSNAMLQDEEQGSLEKWLIPGLRQG